MRHNRGIKPNHNLKFVFFIYRFGIVRIMTYYALLIQIPYLQNIYLPIVYVQGNRVETFEWTLLLSRVPLVMLL